MPRITSGNLTRRSPPQNIKRFECDICHTKVSRRVYLAQHMKSRHNVILPKLGVGRPPPISVACAGDIVLPLGKGEAAAAAMFCTVETVVEGDR